MALNKSAVQPFSVLMAVYENDRREFLETALESVLTQDPCPEQIVIVQDGPVSEDIRAVLRRYKSDNADSLTVVELLENCGLSAALNEGLQACRNELVARQDADDFSERDRFRKQLDVFDGTDDLALVSAWYDEYDSELTAKVGTRFVPEDHAEITRFARHRTPINHACTMFRKSAVLAIGGYPRIDGLCEDWWLALRLIRGGYRLQNIPESLVRVRGGGEFLGRRHGYEYLKQEIRNLAAMHREGLLSWPDMFLDVLVRAPVRVAPKVLVKAFYTQVLRQADVSR